MWREYIHSTGQLNIMVDAMNAGSWVWNIQSKEIVVNQRWLEIIGYRKDELEPFTIDTWTSLVHPDDLKISEDALNKLFNHETDFYSVEVRMKHKNGSWVWILDSGKVVEWSNDGQPIIAIGTHIDINENKELQLKYKYDEIFLKQIIENTNDIIYRMDLQGNFTYLSPAWTKNLNHSIKRALNHSFKAFVHPDDILMLEDFFNKIKNSSHHQELTNFRLKHLDGSWRYYQTSASPIFENGLIIGYAGIARDISDYVSINQQLQAQVKELDVFFEVSLDLLAIVDSKGFFYRINQSWVDLLGYSIEELKSRPIIEFLHEDDIKMTKSNIDNVIHNKKEVADYINRYRSIDGQYHYIEWKAIPYGDFLYASGRDITSEIHIKKDLINQKNHYEATLMSVADGIIVTDTLGVITNINKAAEKLTGFKQEEALGKPLSSIFDVYRNEHFTKLEDIVSKVVNEKKPLEIHDITLNTKFSSYMQIDDSVAPIFDEENQVTGIVIVFRDVTKEQENKKKIEYLSYHDYLTDFYNRYYLDKVINEIIDASFYPLGIISMDINDLKNVNDTYGHSKGDYIIKKAAEIIRKNIDSDYFFRMGGDEFLVFVHVKNKVLLEEIHKNIIRDINQAYSEECPLSLAYGYVYVEKTDLDIYEGIKLADSNMYENKKKYK